MKSWEKSLTVLQQCQRLVKDKPKDWRTGQAFMNALSQVKPEWYNEITGTEADCFYDDKKLQAFKDWVNNKNTNGKINS